MPADEMTRNRAAYERLKDGIRQTYPPGWFVAVAADRVVGAAADFRDVVRRVRDEGFDPAQVLIVEAGASYPEFVNVFAPAPDR